MLDNRTLIYIAVGAAILWFFWHRKNAKDQFEPMAGHKEKCNNDIMYTWDGVTDCEKLGCITNKGKCVNNSRCSARLQCQQSNEAPQPYNNFVVWT